VEYLNRDTIMGSSVITPEDVLESLMNDGTIDAIRLKIINQLKANVSGLGFSTHFSIQYKFSILYLNFVEWV
jgi:delta-aminolevulinic acid dehydratase/porphobilinogen synthase